MSHITKINGTNHNINSGKVLRSGTAYSVSSGKTLISGTEKDINFISLIRINISDSSVNYYCEEGMTWRQFVNSKYNTDKAFSIQNISFAGYSYISYKGPYSTYTVTYTNGIAKPGPDDVINDFSNTPGPSSQNNAYYLNVD